MGPKYDLSPEKFKDERGAALFASVFGLFLVTILASSLYMVSDGARRTATNYAENNEAFYIAEAGMAHATGLYVLNGQTYNISTDIPSTGVAFGAGKYTVQTVANTTAHTITITSTGIGSNNSTATIEETLQFTSTSGSDAAIVINGSAIINANIQVLGTQGIIHANGTMSLNGNNRAQKYFSATSTISGQFTQPCPNGSKTGVSPSCDAVTDVRQNQDQLTVPDIKPTDLFSQADYRFYPPTVVNGVTTATARITDKLGNVLASNCQSGCYGGWTYNSSQGWVANGGSTFPSGTYYAVSSSMQINRTFGSSGTPLGVTFVADGSVSFSSGASYMAPQATLNGRKFAVVAGADVAINGANLNTTNTEGTFYARHQFNLGGGQPKIYGNIFVYNEDDTALYGQNMVSRQGGVAFITSGDPQVIFNGNSAASGGAGTVQISTWREIRN